MGSGGRGEAEMRAGKPVLGKAEESPGVWLPRDLEGRIALYAFFQLTLSSRQKDHQIKNAFGLTSIFSSRCIISEPPIFHTSV